MYFKIFKRQRLKILLVGCIRLCNLYLINLNDLLLFIIFPFSVYSSELMLILIRGNIHVVEVAIPVSWL